MKRVKIRTNIKDQDQEKDLNWIRTNIKDRHQEPRECEPVLDGRAVAHRALLPLLLLDLSNLHSLHPLHLLRTNYRWTHFA